MYQLGGGSPWLSVTPFTLNIGVFERESYFIIHMNLELDMKPKLALNSVQFCLRLSGTGITDRVWFSLFQSFCYV